jgi:hypothetical protein
MLSANTKGRSTAPTRAARRSVNIVDLFETDAGLSRGYERKGDLYVKGKEIWKLI